MKLKYFSVLSGLIFLFIMSMASCGNEADNCLDNKDCLNAGICVDGNCICPQGFLGTLCESYDPAKVQALLDQGLSPFEIFQAGIPLDSIYGKVYKDGFIFYLDKNFGTGLLADLNDINTNGARYGCSSLDFLSFKVKDYPPDSGPEIEEGARLGDGPVNTDNILEECNEANIAARLCRQKGENWFMPSREELHLMYVNLHDKGLGNFKQDYYWTSSYNTGGNSWMIRFIAGEEYGTQANFVKSQVRAVRVFD